MSQVDAVKVPDGHRARPDPFGNRIQVSPSFPSLRPHSATAILSPSYASETPDGSWRSVSSWDSM